MASTTGQHMTDLAELETCVTKKWLEAAGNRLAQWMLPENAFDPTEWSEALDEALPPETMQFPRETWASYPAKRAVVLTVADRMLDFELNDEQWAEVCFLMQYGGKTQLS